MGNPRPTKCKPIKIGRKHTQADSSRVLSKKQAGRDKWGKVQTAKSQKLKDQVAAYWRGELDSCPY